MAKARTYSIYGAGFGNAVKIEHDEITPFLQAAIVTYPKEFNRATRHVAYWLRGELKSDLRAGKAGTHLLKPLARLNKTGKQLRMKAGTDPWKRHKPSSKKKPLQKMIGAIGYKQLTDGAVMGWLSKSAARYSAAVQSGARGQRYVFEYKRSQPVTPAMRRYMSALGIGIRKTTTTIEQQPRPVVQPFLQANRMRIILVLEKRLRRNIRQTMLRKIGIKNAA